MMLYAKALNWMDIIQKIIDQRRKFKGEVQ